MEFIYYLHQISANNGDFCKLRRKWPKFRRENAQGWQKRGVEDDSRGAYIAVNLDSSNSVFWISD